MKVLEFPTESNLALDNMEEFLSEEERFLVWLEYTEPKINTIRLESFSIKERVQAKVKGKILLLQSDGYYKKADAECREKLKYLPLWLQNHFPHVHHENKYIKKLGKLQYYECNDCKATFSSHLKLIDVFCRECGSIHVSKDIHK